MLLKGGKRNQSQANTALPLETVTLKMNWKALLVHILLDPGIVEKPCGRGKALCKG